jgi:hypothetical protein
VIDDFSDLDCVYGYPLWVEVGVSACVCDDGWTGDSCSEAVEDYDVCTDVICNGQGECNVSEEGDALCWCDDGYSGDHCEYEVTTCGYEYLMDLTANVYDIDTNAALDCSFFIGLLWTDMTANSITGYPGLCTCLDIVITNMTSWANNVGCIVEENFPLKLYSMNRLHCNHCTDDEITNMKAVLQNVSESCDMFITHRDEMPLYWRTPLKCVCLESLGETREEVGEYVYCPFTAHAARTDLTAYDNCISPNVQICDFRYVKNSFEIHLKERSPSGFGTCTAAMIDFFEMIPGDGTFSALPEDWCPCYETLAEFWSDGLEVLECHAVTFYEFTIKDLFLLYCNDEAFVNKDNLWSVAKVATVASHYDYVTASSCANFVTYGSALTENATDASIMRAETLFCSCLKGLEAVRDDNGFEESGDDNIFWGSFAADQFADGIVEMEDLLSLFPSQLSEVTFDTCHSSITKIVSNGGRIIVDTSKTRGTFSTSTLDTDTMFTVNVVLVAICSLFLLANFYYCYLASKGKTAYDTTVPVGFA